MDWLRQGLRRGRPGALGQAALVFTLGLALLSTGPARAGTCKEQYNQESKFLANPDESILIAGVIGWCRNNQRRLIWDERYAAVARKWSGFLVEAGEMGDGSLPQDRLRFELRLAGVTDAAILPYSARGPSEKIPPGLLRFLTENVERGRYTHFAVGVTRRPDQKQMVTTLILGRRPALVRPFPVCPAPGSRQELQLMLRRGYSHPRWLMTTPRGDVVKGGLLYEEGAWRGQVPFDGGRGEYTMEIVVNGPTGPEVAALFPLFAGVERARLPRAKARPAPGRYRNPAEAEQAMLDMINQARAKLELPGLTRDEKLSRLAREHAMQLLFERHATHRSATTGALTDRLRKAGLSFTRALENVSLSPSPEAAHERFMGSPGHRVNVLDPDVTQVGIGIAMERTATEDVLAVCEVFIELAEDSPDAKVVAKVHDLINARRKQKGRFALGLDDELSRLARQSARRLMGLGTKADPQAEGEALIEQLSDGGFGVADASVRYFHTRNPGQVLLSPEVFDNDFNRLGVGIARSSDVSQTGEMWIALIFAGR